MAKINVRPLDDRVVVEPLAAEETTAGGIVLPDSAQEKPQRGTVVAVGPGKLLDNGNRGELSVNVGDEVIYGKYGGSGQEHGINRVWLCDGQGAVSSWVFPEDRSASGSPASATRSSSRSVQA